MKIKIFDYLLILLFIGISFFLFNRKNNKIISKVEIISPYKKILLKLPANKIIKVKGFNNGYLVVQIKGEKVRVIRSTCPNKICIKTGWISKIGESIICVPNKIIIKIVGNNCKIKKKIDFITR